MFEILPRETTLIVFALTLDVRVYAVDSGLFRCEHIVQSVSILVVQCLYKYGKKKNK